MPSLRPQVSACADDDQKWSKRKLNLKPIVMVEVFFGNLVYAELVATFETEEMFMLCLPTLKKEAERQGVEVFESINEEK
jgi:hypothetical protein